MGIIIPIDPREREFLRLMERCNAILDAMIASNGQISAAALAEFDSLYPRMHQLGLSLGPRSFKLVEESLDQMARLRNKF